MALSSEDKKDVKSAFGKAMANKVSKVTRDSNVPFSHVSKRTNDTVLRMSLAGHKKAEAAKSKALSKKSGGDWSETTYGKKPEGSFYTSPTGSKHRIGSKKHKYWAAITKRGEDNKKAGVPND